MLKQEEKGSATAFAATACTTDTMDVVIGVIGRVKLDHPVNLGEIKTSLSDIRAEQNAFLCLAELKVGRRALLLLLFAMDVLDGDVDIVEKV